VRETLRYFQQGKAVADIARIRGFKDSTIYTHLEEAIRAGEKVNLNTLLDTQAQHDIGVAFTRCGFGNLVGAVESLGGRYNHGQLRIYRAAKQINR
jgi:ATP-dependent DNA helicase RecQ